MGNIQKQIDTGSKLIKLMQNGGAHLLGGAGTALGMDIMMNPDEEFLGGEWDKRRIGNTVLNAGLGALGGGLISTGKQKDIIAGLAALTSAPAKDLMLSSQSTINKGNKALDAITAKLKNPPSEDNLNKTLKWVGGGALGLGGLALLTKMLKSDKPSASSIPTKGTLKYKILGRKDDPNDDIEVELPVDTDKFTPDMHMQMDSYIKRQAKKAIRNNARKRDPETGKLIPYEQYMQKYGPIKSASFIDGLTNKPVPEYKKEETETPSTVKEFYRLQAGAGFNEHGATVKSARVVHENIGDIAQWALGAGAGGALGATLTNKHPLGILAGSLLGGLGPGILGRTLARKQNVRSIEEQIEHDKQSPIGEYLIPGYAEYQKERRDMLDRKILSDSFSSAGMNPMPTNHTPEHSKDTYMADDEDEDDILLDEDDFDKEASSYYDIIEKYAAQQAPLPPPPPPAPAGSNTGVGSGPAAAPVKAPATTAVTNPKLGNMQSVQTTMRDLTSRLQNTKLAQ